MTEKNDIENEQESTSLNLIGGRVRKERESQGLSCEEVALQLHLSVHLVNALEAGDEEHLPPMNYITGYLRSYARLLNMSTEELLAELHHDEETLSRIVPATSTRSQVSSRDLPVRLVSYLIILGLITLLVVWWFNRRAELPEQPEAVIESVKPGQVDELALPPQESEPDKEMEQPEPIAAPVEEPAASEEPEQLSEKPVSEVEEASESPSIEPTVTEAEPEITVPDDAVLQNMRMVFDQDSWIEVKDALGRKVIFGLFSAGRTIEAEGVAPLEVLLGYAPGVELYYNGEFFDHSPYTRQDVARFTLGQSDQERP